MKRNGAIIFSAILIALALIYCGKNITKAINTSSSAAITASSSETLLINEAEAAKYLGIKAEDFTNLVKEDIRVKQGVSVFQPYQFVPYIVVKGDRYYNKSELVKWVEFNMHNK